MSTDIKPGQIVPEHRASAANCRLNPGVSASGNRCFVCEPTDVTPAPHADHLTQQPGGCGAGCFEAAVAADQATPAPLDPAAVKAGDTVTLESGTALVRDVVIEVKKRGEGQFLFYTGETPDPLIPGTYYLVNPGAWTLTAHQPAPEPEPEWKPGTKGEAVLTVGADAGRRVEVFRLTGREVILDGSVELAWADLDGSRYAEAEVSDFVPDETPAAPSREQFDDMERALQDVGKFVEEIDSDIVHDGSYADILRAEFGALRASASDALGRTTVKVTKTVTREGMADALAQHYGDYDNLDATGPTVREQYLADADAILALLGGAR